VEEDRRRELEWFAIEDSYGGNQDWMTDEWMNKGGCGALAACDTCIYLARRFGMKELYPFDSQALTKEEYIRFGMVMKPYLPPRHMGIHTLELYMDGFRDYLGKLGLDKQVSMAPLNGSESFEEAGRALREQIDRELPVPCLILHHQNPSMEDYVWHWFLLIGYENMGETMKVKAVTYGEYQWIPMMELWNTGYEEKGGLVLYTLSLLQAVLLS